MTFLFFHSSVAGEGGGKPTSAVCRNSSFLLARYVSDVKTSYIITLLQKLCTPNHTATQAYENNLRRETYGKGNVIIYVN